MAERKPDRAQSDDAELLTNLVRILRVVGPLGRLDVADVIVPVISLGSVTTPAMTARQPAFREGDVFTAGVQTAAPGFTEHARTDLPRGTYDIQLYISPHTTETHVWDISYTNPALPSMVTWSVIGPIKGPGFYQTLAWEFDEGGFMRIRNTIAFGAGVLSVATIFARIRT